MISLIHYKEFYNDENYPSLKDSCLKYKYENQDLIADFLENGKVDIVTTTLGMDVFTNKPIRTLYYMNNDDFCWNSLLPHYVREHNLRFPKEIEDEILKQIKL